MHAESVYAAFEKATHDWGLDYTRSDLGGYEDSTTGMLFGPFALGYEAGQHIVGLNQHEDR